MTGATGLWVLAGTVVVGLVVGVLLRRSNGRIRQAKAGPARHTAVSATPTPAESLPEPVAAALVPGSVTLVQLSTTFCAPCRHTRAILTPLAERTDGLVHVDLDVTDRPEVAHRLGVLRTPTTVAYGDDGTELLRVQGVPKSAELLAALERDLPTQPA